MCDGLPKGHGFLRISQTNPYYFQYDDGAPFFVVGENIATLSGRGTFAADEWYGRLAGVGGNFVRIWWCTRRSWASRTTITWLSGSAIHNMSGSTTARGVNRCDKAGRVDAGRRG